MTNNRRGELWINTREKPRPVFRVVQGTRVASDAAPASAEPAAGKPANEGTPAAPAEATGTEAAPAEHPTHRKHKAATAGEPLPSGPALLDRIRPHMRRNRREPGGSGSTSFLSRALRCTEADLVAAFKTLGLVVPEAAADQPVYVEIGPDLWWLNLDSRGGLWILRSRPTERRSCLVHGIIQSEYGIQKRARARRR